MWNWLLGAFLCAVVTIICCAAFVALFRTDAQHRKDGYRVLALLFGASSGGAGLLAVLLSLHESGLL